MDATALIQAIGEESYSAIQSSNLPKLETMTLLQIWEAGSRPKLRALAQAGELLPLLKRRYRQALEVASETRGQNGYLTLTECLQVAELPLKL